MSWSKVGEWLKSNGGTGVALVGSLLTGNVHGAVAAGAALVSSATGSNDPDVVLQSLQSSPETLIKLRELANQESQNIRENLRLVEEARLKDAQLEHSEQQATIRSGDNSSDDYVRKTRPLIARQSWYTTAFYVIFMETLHALGVFSAGASWEMAAFLIAPAGAYLGFRSVDKLGSVFKKK